MKKKILAILMTATFVVGLLAGCSTPTSSVEDKDKKSDSTGTGNILRYPVTAEPPTLDPQLANSIPSATVCYHLFDNLMRNDSGDVKPAAAESYKMSDDGLTYTFKLRESYWSDGEKVKAQDFVYGMQRLEDPATASEYAFAGMIIKNASKVNTGELPVDELGVSAPDDSTVVITLERPASYFLAMLSGASFAPTRKDIVEKYGKDFAAEPEKNVYNGPFKIAKWSHGDRITLAKNDKYWDADSVKLDGAEVITVQDRATSVAMFDAGDLDIADVPSTLSANYKDKTISYYDGSNDYIMMNQSEGSPLASKNLRLAINFALDRENYVKLSHEGIYAPNTRFVLPQVNGVDGEYGDEYPYEAFPLNGDKDKANEYLQAALPELGASSPADVQLELLTGDTEETKKEVEVIQAQLQDALGIKVNIKQVPYKQRLQMEAEQDYQMVVTGWVPDYPDPYSYLELWTTDSTYNHAGYSSEEYDKDIELSNTSTDPKERMDALFDAEKTFCDDGVVAPLQLRQIELLKNEKLKDFKTYFVGLNYNFVHAYFED
ncbi:peptide ABC transporter substrate-binding protein [Clostridium sp. C105KSO13]|uniref:peptide ABC transporter substrate-binding protein n=1 Tax=Clostridium sp. C105KSO13 TaxID=1776045 RepID=UPI00074074A8|nr:peptide ABC transporter substrate-binding protein [Clostridium sp. C105KSO13]CUX40855.1 Oligopeptide-binding protein OppA precursor [Clostridium sp. C105KSO13]